MSSRHHGATKADLAASEVRILRETAIVSLLGRGFFRYQGLARRIFEALSDVNVVMISFAASDVNISVVVEAGRRACRARPPSRILLGFR